jgi:hypothetical protein
MSTLRQWLVLFGALIIGCAWVHAQNARITVTVVDENEVGLADALVEVVASDGSPPLLCHTGPTGECLLTISATGRYKVRIEKENFYSTEADLLPNQGTSFEFTLARQREVRETVNVTESPPTIDAEQVSAQAKISGVDIINLPYPTTRDYRNALEYIPQVVNDIYTQPHITGAETYQTLVLFDGFNVTQPANGQLLLRVSTDSFRSINVETSRVSAEYGKSSGGVLELNSASGDDHFRFSVTDFFPSFQNKHGWTLDKLTPRLSVSGPLSKGRAWFYDAIDAEYDNIIITELPPGADSDVFWRVGNLFKVQGNLTSRNIVTGSFNVNFAHDQHSDLSLQNPQASTPALDEPMYQGSLKEQYYSPGGQLLETGFGFNRYNLDEVPHGDEPYFINPNTASGSYYLASHTQADRWQIYSNFFLKPVNWHGSHQFKVGVDLDRLRYDFNFLRQPISYLSEVPQSGQSPATCADVANPVFPCSRYSQFSNPAAGENYNTELSGYAQDRWLVTNRFLFEGGLRFDWDEIVRGELFSPRLAATYVLSQAANTKISCGIGVFHDATPLFLIARPHAGMRIDDFFFYTQQATYSYTSGPVTSVFSLPRLLEAPRYINWSFGLEQKLPARIYLKAEFLEKRSANGFDYNWLNPVNLGAQGVCTPQFPCTAQFQLQNGRNDRFDSVEINLRRVWENGHMIMGSYIRSRSHSDQVLDLNVDNPVFSTQQPGPYPWDAPNRFLSWGFLPLPSLPIIKRLDFGYSMEYRTGFPFYLVNNQQQFVTLANTPGVAPYFLRFAPYFVLNPHIEKRFHAFGYYWALRGGFDNITNRYNYGYVNNNVQSPEFLAFSGYSGRAFTARIRLLGKK